MYCPQCAAQVDGMKYCRQCGANVSLVLQALSGQLPATQPPLEPGYSARWPHHRRAEQPSIECAARSFFAGLGFLFVSLAIYFFFPGGFAWWFWLLIPAFAAMGKGVGQYLFLREKQRQSLPLQHTFAQSMPAAPPQPQFQAPTTAELRMPPQAVNQPASITEHTTRHLDATRSAEQQ
jgi:hypothetical protein